MNDSELELYGIVGRMFREIREENELSLTAVSEYLQIAPISLQRYECGERKIKMGTIKKLCVFYKIEYDDFIKEAKLRFSKNIFTDTSSEKEELPKIIKYYEMLNDIGKHEATKRVEELTYIPQYTKKNEEDYLKVNAAHARTDIEPTEEDQAHDDAIMNDDSEWE